MLDDRVIAQVARWRDELIDLTRRNRLLNFTTNRSSAVEITAPGAGAVIDGLSSQDGWRFHYPPQDELVGDDAVLLALEAEDPDLTDELQPDELLTNVAKATDLSRILHNLERKASQEFLDKGLHVLYLGVGILQWTDGDKQSLASPLVLVPVSLERPNPRTPFRLVATDDDIVANPALAVKLDRDYEIKLPDPDSDDFNLADYVAAVRASLGSWGDGWQVTERVVLSYFSFHKEAMYRDLLRNETAVVDHPAVRALALGPGEGGEGGFEFVPVDEARLDDGAIPEELASILDADSTHADVSSRRATAARL